ncbi:Z1 domain-containing protein [Nocardiopsis alba]|uniref:Z1 domain-containing protein n=1 Tax=Nocardiopsis alba TaxID=53437 RepID=UPI00339EF56C
MSSTLKNKLEKAEQTAVLLLPSDRQATPDDIDFAVTTTVGILATQGISVEQEEVRKALESRASVFQANSSALTNDEGHVPWLSDAKGDREWHFWDRYRRFLLNQSKLPLQVVRRLDQSTDDVLGGLEDPRRQGSWRRTGLVIGQVQSGKTGQFIGLAAKAADAGYRLIVVFAGIHNDLRSQTQLRIDEGFLGFDTQFQFRSDDAAHRHIGVGAMSHDKRLKAASLTTSHEQGDFSRKTAVSANVPVGSVPVVLVVKKNRRIIDNLRTWVIDNHGVEDPDSGRMVVSDLPLFVIDDEADNAGVNTSKDPDTNPSAINKSIRQLINSFTKASYVGYTATPFANIYINPETDHDELGPDLFPESFIRTLRAPSNYLGPERLFGLHTDDDEEDIEPLPLIRHVRDTDLWMPDRHKAHHRVPDFLPTSLKRAVQSFILSCAGRRARGQVVVHNSMLVHVTRFTAVQQQVREQIDTYIRLLFDSYQDRYGTAREELREELRSLWEEDFVPCTGRMAGGELAWDDVEPHVHAALAKINVMAVNGAAKDALQYHENRKAGLSVIAVGGEKLSRGLTLEGLSISYYLRASKTYDTLLQMGRWFGYRPGYEDLCRLYTTRTLQRQYAEITSATDELRRDVEEMSALGLTPREYGLKIRTSSLGLGITSSNKMRQGTRVRLSYSGAITETTIFDLSEKTVLRNHELLESFVTRLDKLHSDEATVGRDLDEENGSITWSGVPSSEITEGFLDNYITDRQARRVRPAFIAEYIRQCSRQGELGNWTVRLASRLPEGRATTISGHHVGLITRRHSKSLSATPGRYTIKRVLSPADEQCGMTPEQVRNAKKATEKAVEGKLNSKGEPLTPETPRGTLLRHQRRADQPLLLLYPLDPIEVRESSGQSEPVAAPLVGFAISFPFSRQQLKTEYVVNDIWFNEDIEPDDFEDEE